MKIGDYFGRITLAGYLGAWFVYAMSYVGQMPKGGSEPFEWSFPLKLLALFGTVALLGWLAGAEHARAQHDQDPE